MSKSVVVISSYVDSTIREYQPDVKFHLFKTLDELDEYVETTPMRADELFLTKEVFPNVNTSLNYFMQLLENPFLRVDKITYITEIGSPEIASVNYIIDQKKYDNWEIVEGYLTREYVSGIINGNLRNEVLNPKRKAVYRVPRETFLKERLKNKDSLEEEYEDDEKQLRGIPDMDLPDNRLSDSSNACEIYKIVGADNAERTMFAFLAAQYLSFSGKTLILERDVEYHRLTEFVTKSGIPNVLLLEVADLLTNPTQVIEKIRTSSAKLIVMGAIQKVMYRYDFVLSILYNNLMSDVRYLVQEMNFEEAPSTEKFTAVFPATMIGILTLANSIDISTVPNAHFVGIDMCQLPALLINNSKAVATILDDVLETQNLDVQLIAINSLRIGGDSTYDLRSLLAR